MVRCVLRQKHPVFDRAKRSTDAMRELYRLASGRSGPQATGQPELDASSWGASAEAYPPTLARRRIAGGPRQAGESGCHPPAEVSVVAGVAGERGLPTDGPASGSRLHSPAGVAVDAAGNVYIADAGNGVVVKVTPAGVLSIIAGVAGERGLPTEGPALQSRLHWPTGVAVDGAGNVYIADAGAGVVARVTPAGVLSIIAGRPGEHGLPTEGPGSDSRLRAPAAVAVDGAGNVYVADQDSGVLAKLTAAGELSIVAGRPGQLWPPRPGPAGRRYLQQPTGVAVDGLRNVYVTDAGAAEVAMVTPSGRLLVVAGKLRNRHQAQPGPPTAGPASESALATPCGVAVDPHGNLFVVDPYNGVIVKVRPDGMLAIVVDIPLAPWTSMPDGAWSFEAKLEADGGLEHAWMGIAVDPDGAIYIADWYNAVVQKLTPPHDA